MTGQSSESMQVIYMEIEGIKIAIQLAKDAVRIAWQLAKFIFCTIKKGMQDAKYRKVTGRTNLKNLLARANGQPLVPVTMDKETFADFEKMAKKYGILYNAFKPLKTGKDGSMQVMFAEKDLNMVQDLLTKIKEGRIRKDVKNGMSGEKTEQEFDQNNRTETMEEFAANVGADAPEEAFEAAMREQFGENYEEELGVNEELKKVFAGREGNDEEKIAEVINFKERAAALNKDKAAEVQFMHDEKKGKSQIVNETETHVEVGGKGLAGKQDKWICMWLPKDSIIPPLEKDAGESGIRTAELKKGTKIVVEDPTGEKKPVAVKAEKLVEEGIADQPTPIQKKSDKFDITISKELIKGENNHAVKTRVPGTYGKDIRFLWTDKKNIEEVYDGKSMLTSLSKDKDYKLYSEDDKVVETIKGRDLYRNHYDPVEGWVRERAQTERKKADGMNSLEKASAVTALGRGRR